MSVVLWIGRVMRGGGRNAPSIGEREGRDPPTVLADLLRLCDRPHNRGSLGQDSRPWRFHACHLSCRLTTAKTFSSSGVTPAATLSIPSTGLPSSGAFA